MRSYILIRIYNHRSWSPQSSYVSSIWVFLKPGCVFAGILLSINMILNITASNEHVITIYYTRKPSTLLLLRCIRIIYDRVRNRKNYFEINAFLNFERGTSRAGNSNENKNTSQLLRSVTLLWILNFPALDIPRSIGRKVGI